MRYLFILLLFTCNAVLAQVNCQNVPVNSISSSSSHSFHGMNKGGANGPYLYLKAASSYCTASNGEDIANGVYLVIDEIGNKELASYEIKQYWLSLMLTAKAADRNIRFSGKAGGKNNHNITVVEPTTFAIE